MLTLDCLLSQGNSTNLASNGNYIALISIGSPTALLTLNTTTTLPIKGSLAILLAYIISNQLTLLTIKLVYNPISPQLNLGESIAIATIVIKVAKHKPKVRYRIAQYSLSSKREAITIQRTKKATR